MTLDVTRQGGEENLATSSLEVDFALVLSRIIDSMRDDPAQLRNAVYQLARIRLKEEVCLRESSVSMAEIKRLRMALETAIQGVETLALKEENSRTQPSGFGLIESDNPRDPVLFRDPILFIDHSPIVMGDINRVTASLTILRSATGRLFILAAVIIVVLYATLERRFWSLATPEVKESAPTIQGASTDKRVVDMRSINGRLDQAVAGGQHSVAGPQSSGLPLPSVYGVYAISNGQLNELDVLPGRAPDQRVHMSTPINKPSHTILPDGRVVFVVFRRDLTTSAPDRVSVRAVARIVRGITFDKGKADTAVLEDVWTIRNISYEFRVAPLGENSEMLVFRPEASDFVLPAGRYALVLKGQAYDFTVAGTITEAAQCLERFEGANGTFYTECRNRDQLRSAQ